MINNFIQKGNNKNYTYKLYTVFFDKVTFRVM